MNLTVLAPQWAVLSLLVLLALAALQDAVQLRISNFICAAVLLMGVVSMAAVGFRVEAWQNLVLLIAALTVGTMMFSAGKLGGGDVKLLAATVFWFDLRSALWLLVSVAIAGGILAMVIITIRMMHWSDAMQQRAVILRRKSGIPYGVAIAAGAFLVVSLAGSQQQRPDPRTTLPPIPGAR
jgi:prepilin peptidase CpaA